VLVALVVAVTSPGAIAAGAIMPTTLIAKRLEAGLPEASVATGWATRSIWSSPAG
jgi:hypothetical protein